MHRSQASNFQEHKSREPDNILLIGRHQRVTSKIPVVCFSRLVLLKIRGLASMYLHSKNHW